MTELAGTKRENSEVSGSGEGEGGETSLSTTGTTSIAISEGEANKRMKLESGAAVAPNPAQPQHQPQMSASVAVGQPSQPMKSASESPLPTPQAKPTVPATASVVAPATPPAPRPVSAGAAAMAAVAAKPAASAGSVASAKVSQPQSASTSITHAQKPPPIANGAGTGTTTLPQTAPKTRPDSPPPPLKALTFRHLQKKYSTELDYMLVEFRKLERQLLGAPPNPNNPKPEVAGSKERREKLHGFITHLEDTIRQVSEGCVLEEEENKKKQKQHNQLLTVESLDEKKTDCGIGSTSTTQQQHEGGTAKSQALPTENFTAAEASLSHLTPAKEKEESVQRLEEHILANLLPVKIRLTRQLAAQKGATRNPATAPVQPGGAGAPPGVGQGGVAVKGSFAQAAEAKRKAQERALALQQEKQRQLEAMKVAPTAPSQYGKPIGQARSSLTSRLHGRVLGGDTRSPTNATGTTATTGAATSTVADPTAVGGGASPTKRQILYAGMAPGSTQVPSSINAVSGVHPGLIGEDAARAVSLAEDERKRLAELEASAARVALGINQGVAKTGVPAAESSSHAKTTASISKGRAGEGPATLAARARAVALASSMSGASKLPRPNHPLPASSVKPSMVPSSAIAAAQQCRPSLPQSSLSAVPSSTIPAAPPAPPAPPPKPKKKHKQANFNDPALSSNQQFDLRLQEARWRQNKRRRERRRQRTASYITGGGRILTQQQAQAFQQQQRMATARMKDGGVVTSSAGIPGATIGITTIPAPKKVNGMHHHHNPTGAGGFGPRGVEYVCAMCNEGYPSSCEINPWWALCSHECPKCGKTQIPRLDITAPSNAMEYHPALLAHLDEGGGHKGINIAGLEAGFIDPAPMAVSTVQYTPGTATATTTPSGITYITRPVAPMNVRKTSSFSDSDVSHTDVSDGEGKDGSGLNYDESSDEEGDDAKDDDKTPKKNGTTEDNDNGGGDSDEDTVAREERMEREEFGFDYKGEKLTSDQARKLLVLIEHASTCPGRHHSAEHRNVCHSTKYLMLHIRDCTGLLSNGDICPFPWCQKVKHLLYHLVSCKKGPECNTNTNGSNSKCTICCPTTELSPNLQALVGLNTHRRNKFKERVKAVLAKRAQMQKAAAAAAAKAAMNKTKTSTPAPVARPRPQPKVPAPAYRTMAAPPAHAPKLAATIGNVAATAARTQVSTNTPMVAAAAKPSPAAQIMSLVNPTKQKAVSSIPAPVTVAAAQSMPGPPMKHATIAVAPTATKQLASPALSATGLTSGLPSALSVTLPTLEEAALEVGDISMSMSDLMGPPSSDPVHAIVPTANAVIVKTEQTNST